MREIRLKILYRSFNDTICLVFTLILIELALARGHRPLPYLLAVATGSNIGSVATITGNPQNMLIASVSQIASTPFLAALGPIALFGLSLDALLVTIMFRPISGRARWSTRAGAHGTAP